MYALDFEYDGQYLSDYGFIICDFDSSSGAATADAGSKISFNTVSRNYGKQFSLQSATYDECIETTFAICKNPDVYDDLQITNDEYRDLVRWLNRREFLKFQVLDEDDKDRETCYYEASFNIEKVKISEILYGLNLTMITNKPFGYGQEQSVHWIVNDVERAYLLSDISDEIGYIYPDMEITITKDGDLIIYNELEDSRMSIKNCTVGEVITIKGDAQIITTSVPSHKICNDFNFEFLKIGNTINNRNNRITFSLPCRINFTYNPVIKDSPN